MEKAVEPKRDEIICPKCGCEIEASIIWNNSQHKEYEFNCRECGANGLVKIFKSGVEFR